uniref:Elongation factor 1-beta n=1 Tax=Scolopendra viridis TaxID=118503 RepID=A0A4D5R9N5_SCOVI
MGFGDLSTTEGLKSLNDYLALRSYIEGYQPSQADTTIFEAFKDSPKTEFYHVLRWYKHISSYGDDRKKFPGEKKQLSEFTTTKQEIAAPEKKDDDDDVDLFGSDNDDPEAERLKEERVKMYNEKKSKKPGVIAKSSVVLDVKPWDDETDMKLMEEKVRSIQHDGLVWGASKLVPVGYGIHKLQIGCVVEDEKVSIDCLSEEIQEFEDVVQSVDVAAFNKI